MVVDRGVQRGPADLVRHVDVDAAFDQHRRHVVLAVDQRQDQSALLVGIDDVDVGLGVEQDLCALGAAFASREEQRREAAFGQPLVARLERSLALPVLQRRARVHVCAGGDQHLHHLGMTLGRGPHQRGLAAPALDGVDRGTVSDQYLCRFRIAGARADHQRSLAVWTRRIGVLACLEQPPDGFRTAVETRELDRRHVVAIRRLRIGARRAAAG